VEASAIEKSNVMVAVHYTNPHVLDEVAIHAKGLRQKNVYVVFVDETPGLFVPLELKPTGQSQRTLVDSCAHLQKRGINGIPVWRLAEDAVIPSREAAKALNVKTVFVGSSKRNLFWRMVKGRTLNAWLSFSPRIPTCSWWADASSAVLLPHNVTVAPPLARPKRYRVGNQPFRLRAWRTPPSACSRLRGPLSPPTRRPPPSMPLGSTLVLRQDHLGDMILSVPALRRLQERLQGEGV
jgi:hypothetical protein